MIPQGTGGLDREQVRQVFVSIGRPLPKRHAVLTDLASAVSLVPRRTLALLMLLGLAIALALSPAAWGATAAGETSKKGHGGGASASDTPLREIEIFSQGGGPTLYNFLQNFPIRATSPAPAPAPRLILREPQDPQALSEPTKLLTALAFIILVILWIHLRSAHAEHPAPRSRRSR